MSDKNSDFIYYDLTQQVPQKNKPDTKTILKHTLLFAATFISVAVMGAIFFVGPSAEAETFWDLVIWEGVLFAALLLLFLGTHEFGHYFAAVYHRVSASLPYFIPLPFISPIGTVGAVIRIKERISDTIKLYDIGIAGPLAGFVVSLVILIYGFATLPEPDFLDKFIGHDEVVAYYSEHGTWPEAPDPGEETIVIMFGETLLYSFIGSFFEHNPPMWEMYHYPFLLAGWLGLFFTALNLMPVGQLDGGHILYSLIGYRKHRIVARSFFVLLVTFGGFAAIPILSHAFDNMLPDGYSISWFLWALISYLMFRKGFRREPAWVVGGWLVSLICGTLAILWMDELTFTSGFGVWLFFAFLILFMVRIEHPPVLVEKELGPGRKILGWLTMIIFILCISPTPFYYY